MKHTVKWARSFFSVVVLISVLATGHSTAWAYGLMQPATSANLKGIDVSHWQGTIDWNQVKNSGIAFVYAKASKGTTVTDEMFSANVQGARAAGLPIGAYHYATPTAPYNPDQAKAEAQYFVNVMKNGGMGDFGDIMPILDLEEPAATGTLTSDEIASWARVFIDTVKSLTNRQVMIYSGDWFVEQYNDFGGKLADLPVWIAAWTRYGNTQPPAVGGWTEWTAWQYSDQGIVPGISGYVDLDYGPTSIDALRGYLTTQTTGQTVTNVTAGSSQYNTGNYAKLTTIVKDGSGNPLSGATVALTVKNPKGSVTSVSGKTDANGTYSYNYFIAKNLRGTFNVTATTTLANYNSSSASTTFNVVK